MNEVINALEPTASVIAPGQAQLRVINKSSVLTSSTLTTGAVENQPLTPNTLTNVEGLPGRPGHSTIRWAGGLMPVHPETAEHEDEPVPVDIPDQEEISTPPPRDINPSLSTLEKAVACRIYFENLYFPLLRQPPSREQRRLAMEHDMAAMGLSEGAKDALRDRWRQNETEYLREKRRKVDVSAFIKLKTIGHGEPTQVWHHEALAIELNYTLSRSVRSGFARQGEIHRAIVCDETGLSSGVAFCTPLHVVDPGFTAPEDRHVAQRAGRACSC